LGFRIIQRSTTNDDELNTVDAYQTNALFDGDINIVDFHAVSVADEPVITIYAMKNSVDEKTDGTDIFVLHLIDAFVGDLSAYTTDLPIWKHILSVVPY